MKNNSYSVITLFILFILNNNITIQGQTCSDMTFICSYTNLQQVYPNCNNTNSSCISTAESGPSYDCLVSQPWPQWFYFQIDQPGNLDFDIIQNTSFDANGNPTGSYLDTDFICWGPFISENELCDYSQLQSFNVVSCSFSSSSIESFTIPNAQTGEIYVILITNFLQLEGLIKFEQTNEGQSGAGSTTCTFIPNPETIYACEGEVISLDATDPLGVTYEWFFENPLGSGFFVPYNPPETNPTLDVIVTGNYRAEVSLSNGSLIETFFSVEFFSNPTLISPTPLEAFDTDNDGYELFDLTSKEDEILGGLTDVTVSYYTTISDAVSGISPIANVTSFLNEITPVQTIFVRVENIFNGCFGLVTLDLVVLPTPEINQNVTLLEVNDEDGDGFAVFDLTSKIDEITFGQPNVIVTFYESIENESQDLSIANPESYTNIENPQTIHVRVAFVDTGAKTLTSFQIYANPNLGNDEFRKNIITIYPNPVINSFYISSVSQVSDIKIFNFQGKEIKEIIFTIHNNVYKIELINISKGIYFISLNTKEGIINKRLVKI